MKYAYINDYRFCQIMLSLSDWINVAWNYQGLLRFSVELLSLNIQQLIFFQNPFFGLSWQFFSYRQRTANALTNSATSSIFVGIMILGLCKYANVLLTPSVSNSNSRNQVLFCFCWKQHILLKMSRCQLSCCWPRWRSQE